MSVRIAITSPELLGFALQQGRLVRGLSQRQLADALGIGQKWVWEMESGKPGLLMERLFAMLEATGVEPFAEIDENRGPRPSPTSRSAPSSATRAACRSETHR